MEETKAHAEQEYKKKPYKKPKVVSEEMFARPSSCGKCETGPVGGGDCLIFGQPQTS